MRRNWTRFKAPVQAGVPFVGEPFGPMIKGTKTKRKLYVADLVEDTFNWFKFPENPHLTCVNGARAICIWDQGLQHFPETCPLQPRAGRRIALHGHGGGSVSDGGKSEQWSIWVWSKLNNQGTASFRPCVHLLGFHFGHLCLTHCLGAIATLLPFCGGLYMSLFSWLKHDMWTALRGYVKETCLGSVQKSPLFG